MKKILILAVMVLGVSAFAIAQTADNGTGAMKGAQKCECGDKAPCKGECGDKCDCKPMGNVDCMKGDCMMGGKHKDMPKVTLKEAKTKLDAYVKANLKGYKVGDLKEVDTMHGMKAFSADATDSSGNKFVFRVSPWGDIMGPISQDMNNKMQEHMKGMKGKHGRDYMKGHQESK